jgi:hypothetical protein
MESGFQIKTLIRLWNADMTHYNIVRAIWHFIRGVSADNFRKLCVRCNKTGQSHIPYSKCIRMRA